MNLSIALPFLNPVYAHQPLHFITGRLLKGNKVRFDANLLEEKLAEHPFAPSLLSISDTLHELEIAHLAFKTDVKTLEADFVRPVLVSLKMRGNLFAVVEQINKGKVKLTTERGEVEEHTLETFGQAWDGIVLALGISGERLKEKAQEHKDSYPAFIRYGLWVACSLIALYLVLGNTVSGSPAYMVLLLLHSVGLGVSWLLVLQHMNRHNALVLKVCESSSLEGCGLVLNGRMARLTPWLNMAEAGLMYFAGTALLLLFFSAPALYFYLAFAAPVVSLYAIYLQAVVIKQWCRLCMAGHGVLLLSFLIALWLYMTAGSRPVLPAASQAIVFLVPSLLWLAVKPFINQIREGRQYKNEYKRLKANPGFFNSSLKQQPRVHIPEDIKVFTFGNLEAEHELVFVSNPHCAPCAQAHAVLHGWLGSGVNFKVTVVFTHQSHEEDKNRRFVEFLAGLGHKEEMAYLLHDWYKHAEKDVDSWADRHLLGKSPLPYDPERLRQWLTMADVRATPAYFVNGYKLPPAYRLEEIRYLVSEVNT